MKKKLTLWILLVPALSFAQVQMKDGAITFDFGKKKAKQDQIDSTKTADSLTVYEPKPVKTKKVGAKIVEEEEDLPNFQRDGLFKALFAAGLNLSQVDGDDQAGYLYPGAQVAVGAMVKFHKHLSVSAEIQYSMKGAVRRADLLDPKPYRFKIEWDYIGVPLMFNVHDKKIVIASVGLGLNYLVRERFTSEVLNDTSASAEIPNRGVYTLPTRKFDLTFVGGLQFLIKRVFGIGARFEYSLIGLKPAVPGTKVSQMHNNSITIRFQYILNTVKKKK